MRRLPLFLAASFFTACASAPPPAPPPTIGYEQKVGWILRLEDQRLLRDPAAIAPPPPAAPPAKQRTLVPLPPPATPDLVSLVTDSDSRVRRRAALAIGRVGLADGVTPLTTALKDTDADVRQMAAFGLGLLGADAKAAAPALTETLNADASPLARGRAAEALGSIGDTTAAPAISALVAAQVKSGALNAIAPDELGYPLAPEVEAFRLGLYALVRLKAYDQTAAAILDTGGQPAVRWWPAAYALQRLADKRALPALQTLLRGEGTYTAALAARGLGGLKDAAAVPALLDQLTKPTINARLQYRVVEALGAIGDPRAAAPVLALLDRADLDPNVRLEAVTTLGRLKVHAATDRLLDLMGDRWPSMRIAAFRALAASDPDSFVGVLSAMDPDADWVVRAANAETLAGLELPNLHATLTSMLKDQDQRTIPSVLRALAKAKAPGLEAILLERLKSDDLAIRSTAANLLGEQKTPNAAAALQAAWAAAQSDQAIDLRGTLLDALAALGPDAARAAVTQALADRDWSLRLKAAELLKKIDPAAAATAATTIRPAPTRLDAASYDALVSPKVSPHVFIETKKGSIEIELAVLDAPVTAHNFLTLARAGFFNGLRIHRIVPDFVVQDGDPRGDGEGGPNYSIRDELNDLPYLRGTVGMALSGKDTGGSQWFVTMSPQPHLDARYTIFGRVVKGMEVVDRLQQWDTIDRVRVWDGVQMTQR